MKYYNQEITKLLSELGANDVGFADLSPHQQWLHYQYGNSWDGYPYAVTVVVNFPKAVVNQLLEAPSHSYLRFYDIINDKLDGMTLAVANYLEALGFAVFPVPASQRSGEARLDAIFSSRAAAHWAGLGWIGKSCSLITEQRGPRLRLATVLTDAPFICGTPMNPQCGNCQACIDACPVGALKNVLFANDLPLSERFDGKACDQFLQQMRHSFGKRICGRCIAACPHGR